MSKSEKSAARRLICTPSQQIPPPIPSPPPRRPVSEPIGTFTGRDTKESVRQAWQDHAVRAEGHMVFLPPAAQAARLPCRHERRLREAAVALFALATSGALKTPTFLDRPGARFRPCPAPGLCTVWTFSMNGANAAASSHGRKDNEQRSGMPLLRSLRRRTSLAYLLLGFSLIYLLSDQVTQILSLPQDGGSKSAASHGTSAWNLFYHLGGNGPWIPKHTNDGSAADTLPDGCVVDQVHMMSRHGERYPTQNAGNRHLQLLNRLKSPEVRLSGSLEFLHDWTYFTSPEDPAFENLTSEGPYAGTKQARDTGRKLRERYNHLLSENRRVRFWSCSSGRDVETARFFADGFFGPDWEDKTAQLEVIPEEADRGGDTLTPGDTCRNYVDDLDEGHDKGYGKLEAWQKQFSHPIAERLSRDAAGIDFSHLDVYSMMEMCGFEILARGSSPWCDIFTHAEWRQFEYARDLLHFYRAGPGNRFSRTMGWLYLNATADLLMNTSSKDVYFSFVHDGDIVPLLAALRIFDEPGKQELPVDQLQYGRHWKTSDVVPMGGRILFERIACEASGTQLERYVRLSVNDGVLQLPHLAASTRVRGACPVEDFWKSVSAMLGEYGEFAEVCGLPVGAASRISFLHQ